MLRLLNRTPKLTSISLWQMIVLSLGIGNLPVSYELRLFAHRKGEILCLFQKNIIAHLVAKQGKGRTPSKDFQEKPACLKNCTGLRRSLFC